MTLEMIFLLALLAVMIFFFITEKLPIDLVALTGLILIAIFGYITPKEAFSGFSSPAIITMVSMFIVGSAFMHTGVADKVAKIIHGTVGTGEVANIIAIMAIGAFLSAFMNNIAATAVLLPAVVSIATLTAISPSRLLLPLAFATILGGTTTLIGTSPNILASEVLRDRGLVAFEFFDFTLIGVAIVITGIAFVAIVGRRLLPVRVKGKSSSRSSGSLAELYKLKDRLCKLKIPLNSGLSNETLGHVDFAKVLGLQVVSIIRGDSKNLAPHANDLLRGGDSLVVRGRFGELETLLKFRGVRVEQDCANIAEVDWNSCFGAKLIVSSGNSLEKLVGLKLTESHLKEEFGLLVLAIERDGALLYQELNKAVFWEGDRIWVIGKRENLDRVTTDDRILPIEKLFHEHVFLSTIPKESALANVTLSESRLGELAGFSVLGIVRDNQFSTVIDGQTRIFAEDKLLVTGDATRMKQLSQLGELEIEEREIEPDFESKDIGILEIILAPRSSLIGKTLSEINFRDRYDHQVLAIWRGGRPLRARLSYIPLEFGDALLIQGPREKMKLFAEEADFVVLSDQVEIPRRKEKGMFAVFALALVVLCSALKVFPVHMSAALGALMVLLSGSITMEQAYKEINWRIVFLVAALIPIGLAVEGIGIASWSAERIVSLVGDYGPLAVMISLAMLASLLSQTLDNTITVILLVPVTVQAAAHLGVNYQPLVMAITLGTSIAFITPFSHKANLLVMGAGGYKVKDYFLVGLLLSLVNLLAIVLVVPLVFPF